MDEVAQEIPSFEVACTNLVGSMNSVSKTMGANPAPTANQPAAFVKWSADIARDTSVDLESMRENLAEINEVWLELHSFMREAIRNRLPFANRIQQVGFPHGHRKTLWRE